MEENLQLSREKKEFKLTTKKIERTLTFAFLALFVLSLNSTPLTVIFYVTATALILHYFFIVKRNPVYVMVLGNEIQVLSGLMLKKVVIDRSSVKSIKEVDKRIVIETDDSIRKETKILGYFMEDADYKALKGILIPESAAEN